MSQPSFCVGLAEKTVQIDSLTNIQPDFAGYESYSKPDFCIHMTREDIERERSISIEDGNGNFSDRYLEFLSIGRKIAEELLTSSTFLMHGAVVAAGNDAFMFTARSGTGKTTHIMKWLENLPGAFVVNGDKPLIKVTEKEAIAYGTPWCGKEHLNTNIGVPLRAIVLMERSEDNAIEEISFSQALTTLLQQCYRPTEAGRLRKTLALISALNGKVKFYRFRFNNMKPDAFKTSYEALTGQNANADR